MPRFEPSATPLSEPFWEATRSGRLLVQRCDDCDAAVWYPRDRCTTCLGDRLRWIESTGRGEIYTFNVMRKPGNPMMGDSTPYVIALVDLEEGHRMATNVVGCTPEDVRCGMTVEVTWDQELADGRRLPLFRPAS